MRIIVNIFAVLGAVVAVLLTANLYLGVMGNDFDEGRGMAIVILQLYGMIGAAVAFAFGFLGRIIDRRAPRPASKLSNTTIALGMICALLIFAMPFVFG